MQNPPVPGGVGVPPAGGPPTGAAKDQVNGPGIALLVTGGLNILFSIWGFISGAAGPQELPPDAPEQMRQFLEATQRFGPAFNIIPLVLGGLIIFGALKMRNLQSFGLAMAASIIAMIPCLSPCCCIGIPIGIWALVVLNKPEVKAAFQK